MASEAHLRANAAFHAKRLSEGWKRATIWLCPETLERLGKLLSIYDSRDAAIEAAVEALPLPEDG